MSDRTPGVILICYALVLLALWIPLFYFAEEYGQAAKEKQHFSFDYSDQVQWNTIPWRIDCELEGKDLDYGLEASQLRMEQYEPISDQLDMMTMMAYILIGFTTAAVCCVGGSSTCG